VTLVLHKLPDQENSLTKEWIVTNGIGGYASSTIIGTNTRRYHGLLVAAFNPPTGRKVMVSKVDESIYHNNQDIYFSTNHYPDTIHPAGYNHIEHFERDPLPCVDFRKGNIGLRKTIFMVYNSNTTLVEYTNTSGSEYLLKLNPLLAVRDYHSLLHEQHDYKYFLKNNGQHHAVYACAGAEPLYISHSKGNFIEDRHWHKNLYYEAEQARGQDHLEDVYSVGRIEHSLIPGETLYLMFTTDPEILGEDPVQLKENELQRINQIKQQSEDEFISDLLVAADQFIVHRRSTENYSVIAGYHWFTDWGRDSMIALRGLCIATGKKNEARSIISTFLACAKQGIIPNRFTDYESDKPEYNTMDATLWMFIAIYEYDLQFNDKEFLETIAPQLKDILYHHINGTINNIHVTERGLLCGSNEGLPLTWMDARINRHVFTPRSGCPVEINALWYNALKIYDHILNRLGLKPEETFKAVSYKLENNFEEFFWNKKGYLNDCVSEMGKADESIRPNQVYVVSLPFTLLPKEKNLQVVETIREHLLTDYGLRTLSPDDKDFKELYEGDLWARDAAYHQGTVWPFLLPEYILALLKVHDHSSNAKKEAGKHLKKLKEHFYRNECLYGISEVFDGLSPSKGKGCIHQAWSVSNLLLLLLKEKIDI
jgi:predicted glycogen debranching enzyme